MYWHCRLRSGELIKIRFRMSIYFLKGLYKVTKSELRVSIPFLKDSIIFALEDQYMYLRILFITHLDLSIQCQYGFRCQYTSVRILFIMKPPDLSFEWQYTSWKIILIKSPDLCLQYQYMSLMILFVKFPDLGIQSQYISLKDSLCKVSRSC